jgi:hypothetical protein
MAGIESLRLALEVAVAWKKRVAVRVNSKGVEVARSNRHAVLRRANEILKAASAFFAQEMDPTRRKY